MPGARDRHVRLALSARNQFLKDPVASSCHRIAIAESRQQWFLPTAQDLTGATIGFRSRVIRPDRHEQRELTRAGLVTVVWERSVVGRNDFGRRIVHAPAFDYSADMEVFDRLRILAPAH